MYPDQVARGRLCYKMMMDDVDYRARHLRALIVARTERSRAPHCGSHLLRKPNAYTCVCSNIRMLHWQHTPCPHPTCGLTREESLVKAAGQQAEAAQKAERAAAARKLFGA